MKAWRRSSRHSEPEELRPGPVLTNVGAEVVEASGVYFLTGGVFLRTEIAPAESGPFVELTTDPIISDPQNVDAASHAGEWVRSRVEFTSPTDVSDWSNVLQVTL